MLTGFDVIHEARSWIGTPFKHQGRKKGYGIDCVGLIYCVGKELNIMDHDMSTELALKYLGYPMVPKTPIVRQACEDYLVHIPHSKFAPGDVVLMRYGRVARHVGIFAGDTLIHVTARTGKCVEHSLNKKWRDRFCGYYRYPGLVNE